jgi:hypothetical protein
MAFKNLINHNYNSYSMNYTVRCFISTSHHNYSYESSICYIYMNCRISITYRSPVGRYLCRHSSVKKLVNWTEWKHTQAFRFFKLFNTYAVKLVSHFTTNSVATHLCTEAGNPGCTWQKSVHETCAQFWIVYYSVMGTNRIFIPRGPAKKFLYEVIFEMFKGNRRVRCKNWVVSVSD